ncbi:DUF1566 domain-containing protein [bacterium]|nr:DUF1566 domain-containing protein [bacterium]
MKKNFICSLLFAAMLFMIGCGSSNEENNDNNGNESGSNDDNNSSECTTGNFKCIGSESHYCNSNGSWVYDARCENGCDSSTGKCNTNSGSNNNDTDSGDSSDSANNTDSGDSSDSANDNDNSDSSDTSADLTCTTEGAFRCNGDLKQECKSGTWNTLEECNYGCDPVTKKCLGSTECKTGEYECIAGNLSYCNNNFWEIKEKCEYGCDAANRQCLPEDCWTTRIYLCGDSKEAGFSYASYYCEDGVWHYDKTCPEDCDKSTGKCKAVCTLGEYKCEGDNSMLCEDGFWVKSKTCPLGCNSSTGKCNDCGTINGKTWSFPTSASWSGAKTHCDNLTLCGYSDWRLPSISELRTLIQNCPATVTGGSCGVTDSCLSSSECKNDACSGCSIDSKYSKLGDRGIFWSSSVLSDNSGYAWYVDFHYGSVGYSVKTSPYGYVRCVR